MRGERLDSPTAWRLKYHPPMKKGSSRFSGEGGPDLHEEEIGVAVAKGHPLDHLDAVVDALKLAGVHGPSYASQDAAPVATQGAGKADQGGDAAVGGHRMPGLPPSTPLPGVGGD